MASASAPSKRPNGISLAGFRALIDAHGGRAELEGKSTAWVKLNVVIPATAPAKTPFTALMDGAHVAPATAFVSHAYDDEFLGVVDSIASLEAREGTSAFYYFDLLVVNQHGQDAVGPFEVVRDEFGQSVRAIGRTLLYLRWADPIPLGRAWCVFEMGTTLEVGAGLKVIMPPADVASFKHALENDFNSLTYKTCRVDVEKATAREASDLLNIQRAIVEGGGFLKTNQLVIGAMKGWMVEEARSALEEMPVEERATSALINNLANLLSDQGKLGDAEPLYREALAGRRRTLGDEHPSTLTSIFNFAGLLWAQGNKAEALVMYRQELEVSRRVLGEDHPETQKHLRNYNNLNLSKK
jgi:tetratricopeptide (TPR) repeat protein